MQLISLTLLIATVAMYCMVETYAYPPEEVDEIDDGQYDQERNASTELKKLLLSRIRMRDLIKSKMLSPEEILRTLDVDSNSEAIHKAAKRHKMNDLMSRFRALLSDIKERQIKESMELPSLRFGRSGANYRHF